MSDQTFDSRTETTLNTLLPEAQVVMRRFLVAAQAYLDGHAPGVIVKAISGYRSFAEQQALYDQGRGKPGRIVTKAKPGSSWHNYATAIDVGLFKGGTYLDESPLYAALGPVGEALGLEWGGSWTFKDEPHYQLKLGISLAEARRRHDAGTSLLTGTPYDHAAPAPANPAEPTTKTLLVTFKGEPSEIKAFVRDGNSWLSARALTTAAHCTLTTVTTEPFVLRLGLPDGRTTQDFPAMNISCVGYIDASDVCKFLGLSIVLNDGILEIGE